MDLRTAGERIVLTAWVGAMWTVGFVVAPLLFRVLTSRVIAGDIAGRLFGIINDIGLGATTALLLSAGQVCGREFLRRWQVWALLLVAVLIVTSEFVLTPMMQSLRDAAHGVDIEKTAEYGRFMALHGVSATLYVINSVLGLALVAAGMPRARAEAGAKV
jgi:hypothetical protein